MTKPIPNTKNESLISKDLEAMKSNYPNFKIVEEDKSISFLHTAKVFLYDKKYNNFNAKFYIDMLPASFAGANIYQGDMFQYSIFTCSGEWDKRLKHLEKVVGEMDEKGLNGVKSKFGSRIGMSKAEF